MKGFYIRVDLEEMLDANPLFFLITVFNMITYFLMVILSLFFNQNRFETVLLIASFFLATLFFLYEKQKSGNPITVYLFLTVFYIVLFPITFVMNCHEARDMPLFFMLGIIITAVLLMGKKRAWFLFAEIAVYIASFLYAAASSHENEWKALPSVVYIRLLLAVILTGSMGGILLKYRNRMLLDKIRKSSAEAWHARQASRARDIFMGNVSHEIKKPLQTIVETSEMLLGFDLDSQQKENVFYIENAASKLSEVVEEISQYTLNNLLSEETVEEKDAERFYESILQTTNRSTGMKQIDFTCPEAVVMVVDDNLINLEIICSMLEQYQCSILSADSGMACLNLLGEEKVDLIFLDYMMPDMDGVETLQHIRALENENQSIAAIALTANEESGAKEFFLTAGFADYITKPINRKILHQVMVDRLMPGMEKEEACDRER